jgi:hypothetical protein
MKNGTLPRKEKGSFLEKMTFFRAERMKQSSECVQPKSQLEVAVLEMHKHHENQRRTDNTSGKAKEHTSLHCKEKKHGWAFGGDDAPHPDRPVKKQFCKKNRTYSVQ